MLDNKQLECQPLASELGLLSTENKLEVSLGFRQFASNYEAQDEVYVTLSSFTI